MHHPSSDLERVYAALKSQWGLEGLTTDPGIIRNLQKVLRQGEWKITCAVHHRLPGGVSGITAIWPGFHDRIHGLAVDIGSTTVAAHLCSLSTGEVLASAGVMNPQIRFGEDLMSRVSYVMMNPGGDREMTGAIREAINTLAGEVAGLSGTAVTRHSRNRGGRQSGDASFVPRHRSDRARRGALCARDRPPDHLPRQRARSRAQPRRRGLCAALHRRPCRGRCGGRGAVGIAAPLRLS